MKLDGAIARITFSSENGIHILGKAARDQLAEILGQIEADTNCRVVVFAAEGRTFCAGADLQELHGLNAETAAAYAAEGQQLMTRIAELRLPTIAAIHAACAGGGCELALACDFRLGAGGCRIGLPETSIGIIPGWGGTVRTVRLLGTHPARRIVLTAELWRAEEALQLGLLHAVFPDDEFPAAVEAEANKLLTRGPTALEQAKLLMDSIPVGEIQEQLSREARLFAECYATGEPQEGIGAFLEKRVPRW